MEQQDRQEQAATFVEVMKALTHEWGFIVVCTTTTLADDQLATAFTKLRALVLANQDPSAEMDPGTLVLPLMHLPSADISAARATFNDWISAYDDTNEEWDSDVLRDVFIAADDAAVESLLAVGGSSGEPWVVIVDAKYSESGRARRDHPGDICGVWCGPSGRFLTSFRTGTRDLRLCRP
ncbi:hypothetical protein F5883DRAFT_164818 [Diaporthe sp. PMI_573]|jgi:hypothetical protein|nr:hypothetical protein F5883DRAFT_164818 [Diaporthaceae sp. PMI_573]